MYDATPSARRCPRPQPGSWSQISRRGTRPSRWISSQDPSSRSSVFRVGMPVMNLECVAVITNTGSSLVVRPRAGSSWMGTTDHTAPKIMFEGRLDRADRSLNARRATESRGRRRHAERGRSIAGEPPVTPAETNCVSHRRGRRGGAPPSLMHGNRRDRPSAALRPITFSRL